MPLHWFLFIFFFHFDFYFGHCGSKRVPTKLIIQHQESQSAETSLAVTYKRLFHHRSLAVFLFILGLKDSLKVSSPHVRVFSETKAIASQSFILDILVTSILASKTDQETSFSLAPYWHIVAYFAQSGCLPTPKQSPKCLWGTAYPSRWVKTVQDCTKGLIVWLSFCLCLCPA